MQRHKPWHQTQKMGAEFFPERTKKKQDYAKDQHGQRGGFAVEYGAGQGHDISDGCDQE